MKKHMIRMTLVSTLILWGSVSAWGSRLDLKDPDLGARYSTLAVNYGNSTAALSVNDLIPLSQFSTQYAGCYWVIKSVSGVYDDDIFGVGIANYHLTVKVGTPADPGEGPLFPPTPSTPSEKKNWQGPAVVFDASAFSNDDVDLDGLGMTDFPSVGNSTDENALSITQTTNIVGNGTATQTHYLRKQTNGTIAMKTVFSMAGKTATGYGYCWKPETYMP